MKYHLFNCDKTEQLFRLNKLADFEQLWTLDCEWFEEPNYRRNGWSGVVKYPLKNDDGSITYVFIKRQENHNCKTVLHPVRGIPTFRREFFNIKRLHKNHIPTLSDMYYGERISKGNNQSILVTLSLEGYQSFDEYFKSEHSVDKHLEEEIMCLTGRIIRQLHEANLRHGSLYPKHFFVKAEQDKLDIRLIDLEALRWSPLKHWIRFRDLSRLIRHHSPLSKISIEHLLNAYLNSGVNLTQKPIAQQLALLLKKQ